MIAVTEPISYDDAEPLTVPELPELPEYESAPARPAREHAPERTAPNVLEPEIERELRRKIEWMLSIAEDQDPEGFALFVQMFEQAGTGGLRRAGAKVRSTYGAAAMARALGITKSAAVQRYPLPKGETS